MAKDARYKSGKKLIETGYFESFRAIFDHIPKTVVHKDMGIHYQRFAKLVDHTLLFQLDELKMLAGFFDVDPKILIDMAWQQHVEDAKSKKKK